MSKRGNHDKTLTARLAPETVKGQRAVSVLAAEYWAHPTMIHQWKKAVLESAAGISEPGSKAAAAAEIAEDMVRDTRR